MKEIDQILNSLYNRVIEPIEAKQQLLDPSYIIPLLPKIRVNYVTEFGQQTKLLELNQLIPFTKKFKILSLNWQCDVTGRIRE